MTTIKIIHKIGTQLLGEEVLLSEVSEQLNNSLTFIYRKVRKIIQIEELMRKTDFFCLNDFVFIVFNQMIDITE
jgi:hypothetical protein